MSEPPDWYQRDVSRETRDMLAEYAALITKWTRKINLVAPGTLQEIETRHIWDSAQIFHGQQGIWADLGSGGGLPGIVIAILRQGEGSTDPTILIESDQRKATFLRTCVRTFDLNAHVQAHRIEAVDPVGARIVSARALTRLTDLLAFGQRHLAQGGLCVFQKGAQWRAEITDAEQAWRFSWDATPSKTNSEAAILTIRDIARV